MIPGPLLERFHEAIQAGFGALEAQMAELGMRTTAGLKPEERRYVRWVLDNLARRIVAWHERVGPDLMARAEALDEQVRELLTGLVTPDPRAWDFGGAARGVGAQRRE